MHVSREFENLRNAVAERQEDQRRVILEHMDALHLMLNKLRTVREDDPSYGLVLHQIGVHADAVLKTIRDAGIKGIKIPSAMHVFRTSSRQADLTRYLAQQIIS
jgi:hypothetical protein